jgi:hypothetical protein
MTCFGDEGVLMVADVFARVLDLVLEIDLQRPARESKLAAHLLLNAVLMVRARW